MRQGQIVLFVLAVFLLWFAQYVFIPSLPRYLAGKVAALSLVGVVLSMYGLWQVVVRLPIGLAVDSLGREKLLILSGYLLGAAGPLALAFASRPAGLAVGRSLTGLAMGIWVPLVVVFSRSFAPKEAVRASSLLTLVTAAARISATALNGYLNRWGGYTLAFVVAACGTALGALLLLPVPMAGHRSERIRLGPLLGLLARREVMMPSVLGALNQFVVFGATLGFMPLLAARLGADDVTIGLMAATNLVVFLFGTLISAVLSSRVRPRLLLFGTYLLFAGGAAAAAVSGSVGVLFVIQGSIGLAHGIGYPTLMGLSIRDVAREYRTTAMGIHQSVYAAGIFLGPWISGMLAQAHGLRVMFGVNAQLCLLLGAAGSLFMGRASLGSLKGRIPGGDPAP